MNNSLFANSQNSQFTNFQFIFYFFLQEQSDKDDEANDPNDDGEPVAKKSKTMFEEQAIPSEVFGSLKKDE